jgi:dephospho-CoA kinase
MLIGLTGMYCAGKNQIAAILKDRGLPVLDVDKLGYDVLNIEKEVIFENFGIDIKKSDGSVNRRLLGSRVFGRPDSLAVLESIVHPPVNSRTIEWIAAQNRTCVINAALLHKSMVFKELDRLILVTAPYFTRLLRARHRDKLPWVTLLQRFTSQKNFNSQYLAGNAEIHIVENPGLSGSRRLLKKLECRIDKILEGIC